MPKTKEKKALLPELRFPEFEGEWKNAPLSKVLREHKRKNQDGRAVCSVSLEKGLVDQIEHMGRSFSAKDTSKYNRVSPHDVVYTKSPLRDYPYGIVKQSKLDSAVAVSPLYGVFGPVNRYVGAIVEAHFDSPYRSKKFIGPLAQKGAKNTINITNRTFLSGDLLLPTSEAEQQKIADCLGSLDELIAARSAKLAALQDHKRGLLQQLFPAPGQTTPKVRFPGFEGEWRNIAIDELKPFVTSGSRGWAKYYANSGDLFVRITNLSRSSIHLDLANRKHVALPEDSSEGVRTRLRVGDVLISITADIGIVGCVRPSDPSPAYINQHIALVRFEQSEASGEFVSYFLSSEAAQKNFRDSTDNGTKSGLNLDGIRGIRLLLPTFPEQQKIADCLSLVDALIVAEADHIGALKQHKKGLMQKLFPSPERSKA